MHNYLTRGVHRCFLYFKSSCVSALATEILCCGFTLESLAHTLGALRGEYLSQIILIYVAELNRRLSVKTARYNRSVTKNPEVVTKTVTEHFIPLNIRIFIRPLKTVAPFKKHLFTDSEPL